MNGVTITYGKAAVPVYRVRDNQLMAVEVDVEVFGENFLPAYTQGDNSAVVATDSMKNFILRHGLSYEGATLEGFLAELGRGFVETYEDMTALAPQRSRAALRPHRRRVVQPLARRPRSRRAARASATRPAPRCSPASARAASTSSC